jgi:hypothetical protein
MKVLFDDFSPFVPLKIKFIGGVSTAMIPPKFNLFWFLDKI